jgi:hypothetical protein
MRQAVVLAVTIRAGGASSYEVAWWISGQRYTAWVEPHEICGAQDSLREIGFKAE